MSKVIVIPKDNDSTSTKEYHISNDIRLSEDMKEHMAELHKTNLPLYELILQEANAADKTVLNMTNAENAKNKLDFSWSEYTLRDVVVRQFVGLAEFMENLRMLELTDVATTRMLKCITREPMDLYATVLLYYGAPADSDYAFSHVRFIDVIAEKGGAEQKDAPTIQRCTFLRYTREL